MNSLIAKAQRCQVQGRGQRILKIAGNVLKGRARGAQFLISTSVTIQDTNGVGIENARVKIETTFPDGQVLSVPVTTDQTGQATLTFSTTLSGLYTFTVRKVSHPTRGYDSALNIETSDTLVIP